MIYDKIQISKVRFPLVHCTIPFQLPSIESAVKASGQKILTPLVSLDTPGKATVQVVIPADPVSTYSFKTN